MRLIQDGDTVTLLACRPGLFVSPGGSLGFKSEYHANDPISMEVFCVESGEAFWGGTDNSDDRAVLMVQPVSVYHCNQPGEILMRFVLLAILVAVSVGCTDAEWSQLSAYGAKHHVELWSGGKMVKEWTSSGKVLSESHSDGYYFKDDDTNKLVRVTGDLVITPIE